MFQTSPAQARAAGRRERCFWALTEFYGVQEVTGFSTEEAAYWWVPELGSTMCLGIHLFTTKEAAVSEARAAIQEELQRLGKALAALNE